MGKGDWNEQKTKEVHTAQDGRLHIHVTITGAEEDVNEAFRLTAEGIREVRRRLEKRGIEGVGYKIEKSDG